ncbi:MAG: hypothetical protein ACREJO_11080 [Phycisphaerales bacterium]
MTAVAVIGSLALVGSLLVTLLTLAVSSCFTMRIPSGPDAMGLFVFIIFSAVQWVLILAAALMCVGCGGFDWLSKTPGVPTLAVLVSIVALAGLSTVGMFGGLERNSDCRVLWGMSGAVVLPLIVQAYLAILLWRPPAKLVEELWPKLVGGPLALAALATIVAGCVMWGKAQVARSERESEAYAEQEKERQKEAERKEAATITENAELDAMTDDRPLEDFLVRLGIDKTEAHHVKVMERIARLPNLRANIERILESPKPMDREWVLNYVRHCPAPDQELIPAVRKTMVRLAGEIDAASKDQSIYAKGLMWGMLITADAYRPARFDDEVRAIAAAMEKWPDEDARMVAANYCAMYLKGERIPH